MKHVLGLTAVILGLATQASAGSLSVYTTDLANNPRNVFVTGETILLKVTGDAQGGTESGIEGQLVWNGAITNTVSATQGDWLPTKGALFPSEGSAFAFNQTSVSGQPVAAIQQVDTSVITLLAVAPGISQVAWGGFVLDFFGVYAYDDNLLDIPTGHSFCIEVGDPPFVCPGLIPEPATAALVALGLFGLGLRAHSRARRGKTP